MEGLRETHRVGEIRQHGRALWVLRRRAALPSSLQQLLAAFGCSGAPTPVFSSPASFKMLIHLPVGLQASANCFATTEKLDKLHRLKGSGLIRQCLFMGFFFFGNMNIKKKWGDAYKLLGTLHLTMLSIAFCITTLTERNASKCGIFKARGWYIKIWTGLR